MAAISKDTPVFKAIVDGMEREYAFVYPKLYIPGREVMTREEIMEDKELMAELIQQGGDQFRLLSEKPAARKPAPKAAKAGKAEEAANEDQTENEE